MKITAIVPTKLKKRPVDSSQLKPQEFVNVPQGKTYGVDSTEPAENGHTKVILAANSGTFYAFTKHWKGLTTQLITKEQAEYIFGNPIHDNELADLNSCLNRYQINTPARMRHFLAQVAAETAGLKWLKELASGWDYEYRSDLGNTQPGDGPRFRGSGVLQLTGRANYQALADEIGDPRVMEGCDYVAANLAFTSGGFWWDQNQMNKLCDSGADVWAVSRAVNLGNPWSSATPNGIDDRIYYYDRACQVIR